MDEQKIYTEIQWNEYWHAHHLEISVARENGSIRIICTKTLSFGGKVCGAHYRHICYTKKNDEKVALMECNACCNYTYRKLGQIPLMNGKVHEG